MSKASAKPLYDVTASFAYTAKTERELTVVKGDSLSVLKECGQWLFVQNTEGKRGMVPANYTRRAGQASASPAKTASPIPASAATPGSRGPSPGGEANKRMVAIKDVVPTASGQIALKEGEVVVVLEEYATGWLRVSCNGKEGRVPKEAVKPYESETVQIGKYLFKARAIYDYTASVEGQFSFKKGDILAIVKDDIAGGWWLADVNGKLGHVPKSYFKVIQHKPSESTVAKAGSQEDPDGVMPACPFKAVVLYKYEGDSVSTLTIAKDEVLTIEGYKQNGWLVARNSENKIGHVSRKFVKPLPEEKKDDRKKDGQIINEEKMGDDIPPPAEEKREDIVPPPVTVNATVDVPPPAEPEKREEEPRRAEQKTEPPPEQKTELPPEQKTEPPPPAEDSIPPPSSVEVKATATAGEPVSNAEVESMKKEMKEMQERHEKETKEMQERHEKEMAEMKEEMKTMEESFKKELAALKESLTSMIEKQGKRVSDMKDDMKDVKKSQQELAERPVVNPEELQEQKKQVKELDKAVREQMELQRSVETQIVKVKAQLECMKGVHPPQDAAPEIPPADDLNGVPAPVDLTQ